MPIQRLKLLSKIVCAGCATTLGLALGAASVSAFAQSDSAQGFPRKPVRIIVPFPAGGGTDILARPIAQKLSERWGQQVIIDNRGGAGGTIGSDIVAKSPPDGYNVVLGTNGTHGISQSLYRKLPYDTLRDFTPITLVAIQPNILVVHPSVPVKSVKELIAFAKSKPAELNYGSPGNGTPSHLAGESFKTMAGVNITHVPYKGAAPAIVDLLGGQVQVMFAGAPASLPHIRAGKLRPLATTSAKRLSILAEFPTIAESGLPGYEGDTLYGLFGPAGLPAPLLNKINQDFVRVLQLPEIKDTFAGQGAEVATTSPAEFVPMVSAEVARWAQIIKQLGLQID